MTIIIPYPREEKKPLRPNSIGLNEVKAFGIVLRLLIWFSNACSSLLLFGRLLMYNILIVTLKLDLNGVTPNRSNCELNQIYHSFYTRNESPKPIHTNRLRIEKTNIFIEFQI